MKQKWTNVLLLLVFYQSEFGRTLNLGPSVPLESSSVGLVGKNSFGCSFQKSPLGTVSSWDLRRKVLRWTSSVNPMRQEL